jgi:hypothetical protein
MTVCHSLKATMGFIGVKVSIICGKQVASYAFILQKPNAARGY